MSFSFNPLLASDVDKLRALVPDTEEDTAIFSDEQLSLFLSLEDGLKRARGRSLLVAAGDMALNQRLARKLGIEGDAAEVALQLRLLAKEEFERADASDPTDDTVNVDGLFDIAEWAVDPFSAREILANSALRSGL